MRSFCLLLGGHVYPGYVLRKWPEECHSMVDTFGYMLMDEKERRLRPRHAEDDRESRIENNRYSK